MRESNSKDSHAFFINPLDCESSNTFFQFNMKKLIYAVVALTLFTSVNAYADSVKDQIKERKELAKATKEELNAKASKAARKEAKQLAKDGWKVAPGALPIEKQLDRSYEMQFQYDYDGFPKWIIAEAMSTGGNYDAAKMQALALAKQNLAGLIQSEIGALIENSVDNKQMDQSDATSITQTVSASKEKIMQSLGRVITIMEVYRVVNGRGREVLVRIAYSQEAAKSAAKKAIQEDLESQNNALHEELDELLGW